MSFPEQYSQRMGLVNRWERLKVIHHELAIRWKEDYLKALHKRYKWKEAQPNLKTGDLVVIMDDLLPPSEWRLGRVEKTHLGSDNNVRVADVKTATGLITRPIVKLCYLPFLKNNDAPTSSSSRRHTRRNQKHLRDPDVYQCKICRNFHSIRFCRRFLRMDARKRNKMVQKYRYCTNCLAKSHDLRACSCIDTCRICGEWHHTLLHPGIKSRLSCGNNIRVKQVTRESSTTTLRQSAAQHRSTSPARSKRPRRSPTPSTSGSASRNNSSAPNRQILSEAIRSLAEVLCVQSK